MTIGFLRVEICDQTLCTPRGRVDQSDFNRTVRFRSTC